MPATEVDGTESPKRLVLGSEKPNRLDQVFPTGTIRPSRLSGTCHIFVSKVTPDHLDSVQPRLSISSTRMSVSTVVCLSGPLSDSSREAEPSSVVSGRIPGLSGSSGHWSWKTLSEGCHPTTFVLVGWQLLLGLVDLRLLPLAVLSTILSQKRCVNTKKMPLLQHLFTYPQRFLGREALCNFSFFESIYQLIYVSIHEFWHVVNVDIDTMIGDAILGKIVRANFF